MVKVPCPFASVPGVRAGCRSALVELDDAQLDGVDGGVVEDPIVPVTADFRTAELMVFVAC